MAQQEATLIQQQKRLNQYRLQQEYLARLRQQYAFTGRRYDYYRDPYFYTVPRYRYLRSGTYFVITQYGVNVLRDALNYGYEEGYRAGRADRLDGWPFDYRSCYAYRDANFGYTGFYADQFEYNHYFREGFRLGYEDGYYGRYRYGHVVGSRYYLLDNVMSRTFVVVRFR